MSAPAPACRRARWDAIQRDPRWPADLAQLEARGFQMPPTGRLADAMSSNEPVPSYLFNKTRNEVIFDGFMEQRWASGHAVLAWRPEYSAPKSKVGI